MSIKKAYSLYCLRGKMNFKKEFKKALAAIAGVTIIGTAAMAQSENTINANVQLKNAENISWKMPGQDTLEENIITKIYVGRTILGVSEMTSIEPEQPYLFNITNIPNLDDKDLEWKISIYKNYSEFLDEFNGRMNYYRENYSELIPELDRNTAAFNQIKNPKGYLLTANDTILISALNIYFHDLKLSKKETYNLSKIVRDMGKDKVTLAIEISHEGGIIQRSEDKKTITVPGESAIAVLCITHLVQEKKEYYLK